MMEGRRSAAEKKVAEWLEGVTDDGFVEVLSKVIDEKVGAGEYRFKRERDRALSIEGATRFFKEFARKVVVLSDGRCVYFVPDARAKSRNGGDLTRCWAEYAFHAVSSSGNLIGESNVLRERIYNSAKAEDLACIERILRDESCMYRLIDAHPENDAVLFVGMDNEGGRMEVVTRLDEYGNAQANLSEVTVVVKRKGKCPPPNFRPLTEVVETVAKHQAAGFSPSTTETIIPYSTQNAQDGGLKKMKFLITGAYGFVGTNLCKYLVSKGHECHALDIPAARRPDVPYASFHSWDELNHHSTPTPSLYTSYDCVVHLAGKAHDLKKVSSPESYFEINVGLTQRIFDAFRKEVEKVGGERTFIYFSSIKALDGDTPYAQSKRAAEEYLKDAISAVQPSTSNLNLCILQPAMIHGPGNKGNLNLLWGLAKRGLPWPLAAFENRRSFTSIGNICAVVEALAQKTENSALHLPSTPTPSIHTYPIADDDPISTNRIIELISEVVGKRPRLWRLPPPLMRFAARLGDLLHLPLNTERLGKLTENSIVDNSAVKAALGWNKLPIAAEDGLRETLKSFIADEREAQRLANWNMSEYKANQASHTL